MLIVWGLTCIVKDVGQGELPRYAAMSYCLPNHAAHA